METTYDLLANLTYEERQSVAQRVAVLHSDYGIASPQGDNDRNAAVAIMTAKYGKYSVLDAKSALAIIAAYNAKYPAE